MTRSLRCSLIGIAIVTVSVAAGLAQEEELRIRLENRTGGGIEVSRDEGHEWLAIGRVASPANTVNRHGYNASRWVPDSTVAATAVNAIHVKVTTAADTGYGVIFSIVPAGEVVGAATRQRSSIIETDMSAGSGLFGGLGPCVGGPVYQQGADGALRQLGPDYQPAEGDVLVIVRPRRARRVRYIDFENKFGGDITVTYHDGSCEAIGQVLRPVCGVGRFEATKYAAPGRLRVNHAGVIGISTSPVGLVGGFQIIPASHANDAELWYVKTNTQWMVVGPPPGAQTCAGTAPLFAGHLYPSYRDDDITGGHEDWLARTLSRLQVLGKTGEGDWELLPRIALDPEAPAGLERPEGKRTWHIKTSADVRDPLPGQARTALSELRAIRIVLPRETYWPE